MSTDTPKADIEALTDLIQSRGWLVFKDLVMAEIANDFEEHITRALDVPDQAVALDRMRQVAAVRKAGLRWLKLPGERLKTLNGEQERQAASEHPGRRPIGL